MMESEDLFEGTQGAELRVKTEKRATGQRFSQQSREEKIKKKEREKERKTNRKMRI